MISLCSLKNLIQALLSFSDCRPKEASRYLDRQTYGGTEESYRRRS